MRIIKNFFRIFNFAPVARMFQLIAGITLAIIGGYLTFFNVALTARIASFFSSDPRAIVFAYGGSWFLFFAGAMILCAYSEKRNLAKN